MLIPAEIKRLLTEIRRIGRETGVEPRYVSDFNRLYHFYMEMEGRGPNELEAEPNVSSKQEDQEIVSSKPITSRFKAYFAEATATRDRYAQRMEYYLLLKSFYNAFIFPLEQDISIARSCQTLGINVISFAGGKKITQLQLEAYRSGDTERVLAAMRSAFAAVGQISFQDSFIISDFTNVNTDQN